MRDTQAYAHRWLYTCEQLLTLQWPGGFSPATVVSAINVQQQHVLPLPMLLPILLLQSLLCAVVATAAAGTAGTAAHVTTAVLLPFLMVLLQAEGRATRLSSSCAVLHPLQLYAGVSRGLGG